MKRYLYVLPVFILLIQCSPTSSLLITGKTYAPLASDADVKVFTSKNPENFEEIGIIEVERGTLAARIEAAKQKAREIGGNGLIVGKETEKSSPIPKRRHRTIILSGEIMPDDIESESESLTWTSQKFTIIKIP